MNWIQTCTHCKSRWRARTIMPVSSFRFVHNWRVIVFSLAMSSWKNYTPAEDSALLAFVEANKHRSSVMGNKLWRLAEAQKLTPHSWQSMKSRWELISGAAAKKGKKREEKKKREAETQRRLGFSLSISTSTSTMIQPTPSTSTLRSPIPPTRPRWPTTTSSMTVITKGNATRGWGASGWASTFICPVAHYRRVDAATQTVHPPSHRRSRSI